MSPRTTSLFGSVSRAAWRVSQGGPGGQRPEIWTVPAEYFVASSEPIRKH